MRPLVVPPIQALLWWRGIARITIQPLLDHIVIKLLRPQHSAETLTHDVLSVSRQILRNDGRVKIIGFTLAECKGLVEIGERGIALKFRIAQPQANYNGLSCSDRQFVVSCCLGLSLLRV